MSNSINLPNGAAATVFTGNGSSTIGSFQTYAGKSSQMPFINPTDPTGLSWSWVNQAGSTVTNKTTDRGIPFIELRSNGFFNNIARVITVPSAPYTVKALLSSSNYSGSGSAGGLILYDSGSGKAVTLVYTSATFFVDHRSSMVDNFGGVFALGLNTRPFNFFYISIQDDGANRIFSVSSDDIVFCPIYSESNTSFITPTDIGFMVHTDAGFDNVVNLVSWS